jgi:hypothetical protein
MACDRILEGLKGRVSEVVGNFADYKKMLPYKLQEDVHFHAFLARFEDGLVDPYFKEMFEWECSLPDLGLLKAQKLLDTLRSWTYGKRLDLSFLNEVNERTKDVLLQPVVGCRNLAKIIEDKVATLHMSETAMLWFRKYKGILETKWAESFFVVFTTGFFGGLTAVLTTAGPYLSILMLLSLCIVLGGMVPFLHFCLGLSWRAATRCYHVCCWLFLVSWLYVAYKTTTDIGMSLTRLWGGMLRYVSAGSEHLANAVDGVENLAVSVTAQPGNLSAGLNAVSKVGSAANRVKGWMSWSSK